MSFGHHADTQREDAHPLLLIDDFGWSYAELLDVDDQGVPTYRTLESRERAWQGHGMGAPDFELLPEIDDDFDDAELAAAFDVEDTSGLTDEDDALYAELMAAEAHAIGLG